jgi:hypothetical protein
MKFNKVLLIPIVAFIALVSKKYFNVELTNADQEVFIDGALAIVTAIGFALQPKKHR